MNLFFDGQKRGLRSKGDFVPLLLIQELFYNNPHKLEIQALILHVVLIESKELSQYLEFESTLPKQLALTLKECFLALPFDHHTEPPISSNLKNDVSIQQSISLKNMFRSLK